MDSGKAPFSNESEMIRVGDQQVPWEERFSSANGQDGKSSMKGHCRALLKNRLLSLLQTTALELLRIHILLYADSNPNWNILYCIVAPDTSVKFTVTKRTLRCAAVSGTSLARLD